MFNVHQREWMKYLDSLPLEKRCYCGWNRVGECIRCRDDNLEHLTRAHGWTDHVRTMHAYNKFHNVTADTPEGCRDDLCQAWQRWYWKS